MIETLTDLKFEIPACLPTRMTEVENCKENWEICAKVNDM